VIINLKTLSVMNTLLMMNTKSWCSGRPVRIEAAENAWQTARFSACAQVPNARPRDRVMACPLVPYQAFYFTPPCNCHTTILLPSPTRKNHSIINLLPRIPPRTSQVRQFQPCPPRTPTPIHPWALIRLQNRRATAISSISSNLLV
jgi:hypothetical protein